jgi:hypothetical protein
MQEDVTLAAGTIVEHYNVTSGLWLRVPRVTSTGDTGSLAEAKAKTTLEDRIKRYGSGLRDGGDKNFKGNRIPTQVAGSEHATDRTLQDDWITRCKNEEEMQMRITYPSTERALFTFKPLGYMVEDASAEDWVAFKVDGKQNSMVDWSNAPALTAVALLGTGTIGVASGEQLSVDNTPLDAFYEVNQDTYTSDDPAILAVSKWGYVQGISAGTANVTVVRTDADGATVTDVLAYTVS